MKFDDRALALAVLWGTVMACVVFTISVVGDFPRVWPGTITAFLIGSSQAYLFAARRRR